MSKSTEKSVVKGIILTNQIIATIRAIVPP